MVVIPVADGVDVCGFECLILEGALKHGINRCTLLTLNGQAPDNPTRLHFGRRSFGLCHPGRLNKKTFGHRSFGG